MYPKNKGRLSACLIWLFSRQHDPMNVEITPIIPLSDDALLAECEVQTFRAGGPGGQNINRRETAVRLRHCPTGLVVTCQQERTQFRNKQIALAALRRKILNLYRRRKPRIPTQTPVAVKSQILATKKRISLKKQNRAKVRFDESE